MSDIGEPRRKSEGLEKGDERLGRRTPCGGNPGGGYIEGGRPEAALSDFGVDPGGEDPGDEGGDMGRGDPGPCGGGDLEPTWADISEGV